MLLSSGLKTTCLTIYIYCRTFEFHYFLPFWGKEGGLGGNWRNVYQQVLIFLKLGQTNYNPKILLHHCNKSASFYFLTAEIIFIRINLAHSQTSNLHHVPNIPVISLFQVRLMYFNTISLSPLHSEISFFSTVFKKYV